MYVTSGMLRSELQLTLAAKVLRCCLLPQGSLDMSAEELALCSAIAEFRNSIFSLEPPWGAGDVRGVNDKLLLQLIDVSSHPVPYVFITCGAQSSHL